MTQYHACVVPSPLGDFVLAWDPARFPRVQMIHLPASEKELKRTLARYELVHMQRPPLADLIARYAAGEKVRFAWDELDLSGVPPFHAKVYRALFDLPAGKVTTYGDLARAAGKPRAARAVGQAMATNPLPVVVPCHRVVRAGGHLGGFGGGLALKRRMLQLEGVPFADDLHVAPFAID